MLIQPPQLFTKDCFHTVGAVTRLTAVCFSRRTRRQVTESGPSEHVVGIVLPPATCHNWIQSTVYGCYFIKYFYKHGCCRWTWCCAL